MSSTRIGELLVKANVITQAQFQSVLEEPSFQEKFIGTLLVEKQFMTEHDFVDALASQYGMPVTELEELELDQTLLKLIPESLANKHGLLPIVKNEKFLTVAMFDPSNVNALNEVKFITGLDVQVTLSSERAIKAKQENINKSKNLNLSEIMGDLNDQEMQELEVVEEDEINLTELEKASEDAPVVKLVNAILHDAMKRGASDIHIEPYEKSFRVRFRVDGVLQEIMKPPIKLKNAMTSRLKIMARLDISERRLPQDGRIKLRLPEGKGEMDFRVNVLPTLFGEKVVMRLLDKSNLQLDMTKLGFFPEQLADFKSAINKPHGMVLVTGPTGSGKTTTLYSALSELNQIGTNISTAEDPVEFNLPGINQAQMHDDIGYNFASALRAFLRQDPDIIMVGEIRDYETAEIGIKASLTGHLVLSTLHTNSAPATVSRLLNMGVEPFLVASSLSVVVAQRLGRKVCAACSEPDPDRNIKTLMAAGLSEEEAKTCNLRRGAGCETCGKTGYKGRIAFYEVMLITEPLKEFILNGASAMELGREAERNGMISLRRSGLLHLMQGGTTLEEVLRVTTVD